MLLIIVEKDDWEELSSESMNLKKHEGTENLYYTLATTLLQLELLYQSVHLRLIIIVI